MRASPGLCNCGAKALPKPHYISAHALAVVRETAICDALKLTAASNADDPAFGGAGCASQTPLDRLHFMAAWPTTTPLAADYLAGAVGRRFSARHRRACCLAERKPWQKKPGDSRAFCVTAGRAYIMPPMPPMSALQALVHRPLVPRTHHLSGDHRPTAERLLECGTSHLGWVENTHLDHVAVLARSGVITEVTFALAHFVEYHGGLVTRVSDDLTQRTFHGT